VTLYEKRGIAAGSTGRAAGIAYDAFAEDVDAAVAARALDRFRALAAADDGFAFHDTPYLFFATEAGPAVDAIRESIDRMRANGRSVHRADAAELARRFPQVAVGDVHTAALAENAGVADPAAYAAAMAARARALGADVREGGTATVRTDPPRVRVDGDGGGSGDATEYDAVLVAAGADTRGLLADAGVAVPLKAYRVQAVRTTGPAIPILYDATEGYYARPTKRGLLAGDGPIEVADPADWETEADPGFGNRMLRRLRERLINLEASAGESWAGLCTATPDRDPLLGVCADGIYAAAGWHGHGFMRAPALGEAVAAQMLGGAGLPAFAPTRFDGDEAFEVVEGMVLGSDPDSDSGSGSGSDTDSDSGDRNRDRD